MLTEAESIADLKKRYINPDTKTYTKYHRLFMVINQMLAPNEIGNLKSILSAIMGLTGSYFSGSDQLRMIKNRGVDPNTFTEVLYMYSVGIAKHIKLRYFEDKTPMYFDILSDKNKYAELLAIDGKLIYLIDTSNDLQKSIL